MEVIEGPATLALQLKRFQTNNESQTGAPPGKEKINRKIVFSNTLCLKRVPRKGIHSIVQKYKPRRVIEHIGKTTKEGH